MEAEEDLSAHKLLNQKVLCKQNGRTGKPGVLRASSQTPDCRIDCQVCSSPQV